jgi:hypothetical protein
MYYLKLVLLLTLTSTVATAGTLRPIFIRASCEGKSSSAALSSLKEEITASQKYELARSLYDEGRMDIVLMIYMSCVERHDVIAVATNYGLAKCYSEHNCHLSVDGNSIRSTLCDTSVAECGHMLFNALNDYLSHPSAIPFKLN